MARPPAPGPTRASQKLRHWRADQRLSGREAAALLQLSWRAFYRYESGERAFPDALKAELAERGICELGDFFAPELPEAEAA